MELTGWARNTLIASILLTVAACSSMPQRQASTADNSPAAQDLSSVLTSLRAIDPCTLYGDKPRVDTDPISVVGMTSTLSCAARVQTSTGPADVSLGVNITSPRPADTEDGRHQTIDGVDVTVVAAEEPPLLGPQDAHLVTASCDFTARYPDRVLIGAYVSAAPEVDTCAIAEAVIRQAIAAYRSRPAPNPGTPGRTVLLGADPCAAVQPIATTHTVRFDLDNSTPSSCFFTLDGSPPIVVSFDYLDATTAAYSTEQRDVNGHRVFGDDGIVHVVVGEQTTVGTYQFVPTVTITGQPPSTSRMAILIAAVTAQY
ncbi:hypothetical protein QN239_32420 [Mycolicibacterium sp. Y3]